MMQPKLLQEYQNRLHHFYHVPSKMCLVLEAKASEVFNLLAFYQRLIPILDSMLSIEMIKKHDASSFIEELIHTDDLHLAIVQHETFFGLE